jgi:hypothetical protein
MRDSYSYYDNDYKFIMLASHMTTRNCLGAYKLDNADCKENFINRLYNQPVISSGKACQLLPRSINQQC